MDNNNSRSNSLKPNSYLTAPKKRRGTGEGNLINPNNPAQGSNIPIATNSSSTMPGRRHVAPVDMNNSGFSAPRNSTVSADYNNMNAYNNTPVANNATAGQPIKPQPILSRNDSIGLVSVPVNQTPTSSTTMLPHPTSSAQMQLGRSNTYRPSLLSNDNNSYTPNQRRRSIQLKKSLSLRKPNMQMQPPTYSSVEPSAPSSLGVWPNGSSNSVNNNAQPIRSPKTIIYNDNLQPTYRLSMEQSVNAPQQGQQSADIMRRLANNPFASSQPQPISSLSMDAPQSQFSTWSDSPQNVETANIPPPIASWPEPAIPLPVQKENDIPTKSETKLTLSRIADELLPHPESSHGSQMKNSSRSDSYKISLKSNPNKPSSPIRSDAALPEINENSIETNRGGNNSLFNTVSMNRETVHQHETRDDSTQTEGAGTNTVNFLELPSTQDYLKSENWFSDITFRHTKIQKTFEMKEQFDTTGTHGSRQEMVSASRASLSERFEKTKLDIENKRAKLGVLRRYYYDIARWIVKKENEMAKRLGIWNSHLKFIESRFGTGIASYFYLYRWVFVVNLVLCAIWLIFIIMFDILHMNQNDGYGLQLFMMAHGTNGLWGTNELKTASIKSIDIGIIIQEFFSGKGSFQRSFFFYGNYPAKIYFGNSSSIPYYMETCYILVIYATYIISAVLIMRRMRVLFLSRASVDVDDVTPFGIATFCNWDFNVKSAEALENQTYAINTVFKTLISNIELKQKGASLSGKYIANNVIRRIIGNLISLILLGIAAFLITVAVTIENDNLVLLGIEKVKNIFGAEVNSFLKDNQFISITAFIVSFVNITYTFVFPLIAKFERYTNPSVESSITLARTFLTKMASIYVILISFYFSYLAKDSSKSFCWENEIGRTLYQLVWTNLIFTVTGTVMYGFFIVSFRGRKHYDFKLADNILDIIYRQALMWIGCIYCPMVVVASVICGWIIFFVKKFILNNCGLPPRRIYNSYQQNIYFSFFLLVTLVLMGFPAFFALSRMSPSNCGPYSPAEQKPPLSSAYEILPRGVDNLRFAFLKDALKLISSFEFMICVVIILGCWVYYLLAVGHKRLILNKQLQHEVTAERADKKFLLRFYKVKM